MGVRAEAVGQIVAELDETGLPVKRYLWGAEVDQLLAEETVDPADRSAAGNVAWPLADHQNTIRDWVALDAQDQWAVDDHVKYDPFGNIDATDVETAADHLFAYTGRPWDPETGLQNNRVLSASVRDSSRAVWYHSLSTRNLMVFRRTADEYRQEGRESLAHAVTLALAFAVAGRSAAV